MRVNGFMYDKPKIEFVAEWVWIGCYDSTVSWLDSRSFWSNLWSFWLNSIDTRDSQTQIPNLDPVLTIFTHFSKSNYFLDLLYLPLQMVPFKESASLGPPRLNYFIPFYLGCKKTLRHKKQHQQGSGIGGSSLHSVTNSNLTMIHTQKRLLESSSIQVRDFSTQVEQRNEKRCMVDRINSFSLLHHLYLNPLR